MHGAGNDYIYVDAVHQPITSNLDSSFVAAISDRHFGVGSDGVILLLPPNGDGDCRMAMWNADGSRGSMCGNGLRCLAKLARETGAVDQDTFTVETDSGPRRVTLIRESGKIVGATAEMGDVTVGEPKTFRTADDEPLTWIPGDAGNPHAVVFLSVSPEEYDVATVGASMQNLLAGGVNVEFVYLHSIGGPDEPARIEQRTFERGSGETLACGSGATVVAVAAVRGGRVQTPRVTIQLRGGELTIDVPDAGPTTMSGPAQCVFEGEIDWPTSDDAAKDGN